MYVVEESSHDSLVCLACERINILFTMVRGLEVTGTSRLSLYFIHLVLPYLILTFSLGMISTLVGSFLTIIVSGLCMSDLWW